MPIYEYRCEKCGDFEHTQRITDAALQRCPTCKRKVRRLISNTSFQLKGSGWYVTDYARAGKDKESKDGKDGKTDGSGSSAPSGSASDGAKSDTSGSEGAKSDAAKTDSAPAKPAKPESKKRARASA